MACSLRTALASCPPRPWAPSAAAVRSLRTGSALLSGKCGARGHLSCPPGDVSGPPFTSLPSGASPNPARASCSWDPGSAALLPK